MDFLIGLSLILFLTFISNGHTWNISVIRQYNVTSGSDVDILCTFSYPPKNHRDNVQIFWKKLSKSKIVINDVDKNPFIFHPNDEYIIKTYRNRTKLIGDVNKGNCSLKIQNVTENEPNIYLRIAVEDNYSFFADFVSISVSGVAQVTADPGIGFVTALPKQKEHLVDNTVMYITVFVSLAVAVIIIVSTGIVCFKKHRSLTRQESNYYVNFKVSSTPAKRETSFKKQDNKELPEQKVIDDPVYINLQVHPRPMDQSVAHADNIYANVDYTQ